jgi:hypothetical protein
LLLLRCLDGVRVIRLDTLEENRERNASPLRPLVLHTARIILNLARLLAEEPTTENHIEILTHVLDLGLAVRRLERQTHVVIDID